MNDLLDALTDLGWKPGWGFTDRPAVTVGNDVGRGLIGGSGGKAAILAALERGTFLPSPHGDASDYAAVTRITIEEAAMLQTFPPCPSVAAPIVGGLVALDLFAGAGGWDIAAARLGIEAHGVELMPEAVATRDANGMSTVYRDVWHVLEDGSPEVPDYGMLIASPPCQKFSMAGKGTGRSATADVLRLIEERVYLDPAAMRAFAAEHEDDGIALVLSPLAYVARDLPTFVVLEQVPPVLPIWQAYADVMRQWGYSVAVDVLNAEQYGVPQTRRRAILIARADGVEATMPTPTHSRYYSRDPQRLDPGVLPWVSMAEALGWGMTERPYLTVASGTEAGGGTDPAALGGSGARKTVHRERDEGRWVAERHRNDGVKIEAHEAAALQSFPEGMTWCGTKTKVFLQIGNAVPPLLAEAVLRAAVAR